MTDELEFKLGSVVRLNRAGYVREGVIAGVADYDTISTCVYLVRFDYDYNEPRREWVRPHEIQNYK